MQIVVLCVGRKYWEDESAKRGARFDIDAVAVCRNEDVLRRARTLHDRLFTTSSSPSAPMSWKAKVGRLHGDVVFTALHLLQGMGGIVWISMAKEEVMV